MKAKAKQKSAKSVTAKKSTNKSESKSGIPTRSLPKPAKNISQKRSKKERTDAGKTFQQLSKLSESAGKSGYISRGEKRKKLTRTARREMTHEGVLRMFEIDLQKMYWSEKFLLNSLPKLAHVSTDDELIDVIEQHISETEEHVSRLERIFKNCDLELTEMECEAMNALWNEAEESIDDFEAGPVRDAAIIISIQKIEHYEIAMYGSLRALADLMQFDDSVELLQETLDEEGNADHMLNKLSDAINEEAYNETYV